MKAIYPSAEIDHALRALQRPAAILKKSGKVEWYLEWMNGCAFKNCIENNTESAMYLSILVIEEKDFSVL